MNKIHLDSSFEVPGHGKIISALHYLTDHIQDYWHLVYPLIDDYDLRASNLNYFYDLSLKATLFQGPFSKGDLYLFKGYDGRPCLHALEMSQYSLACMQAYALTKNQIWLLKAEKNLSYLCQEMDETGLLWTHHKNPFYFDLPDSWRSALAQSFFISAAARYYLVTHNKKILDYAKRAEVALSRDFINGGCRRLLNNNLYIYEEYPRQNPSGVLNGHISAIFSLIDMNRIDSRIVTDQRLSEEFSNLKLLIPNYEKERFVLYSLDGNIASGFYLRYMIVQLKALGQFDPFFKEKAFEWEQKYLSFFNALQGLIKKVIK